LEVTDESQAKAIVAEDPAVKSGIFIGEMHPWKLKAWDNYAKKAKSSAKLGTRTDATASPHKGTCFLLPSPRQPVPSDWFQRARTLRKNDG
jgi:hypothetical protein